MLQHFTQLNNAVQSSREFVEQKAKEDPYTLVALGLLVGVAASTLHKKEIFGVLGLFGRAITADAFDYLAEKVEYKRPLNGRSAEEAVH